MSATPSVVAAGRGWNWDEGQQPTALLGILPCALGLLLPLLPPTTSGSADLEEIHDLHLDKQELCDRGRTNPPMIN
jgi:hypothetical protein